MKVHASEQQHWYTRTGEPAYEMKGANGNMRAPTLRDARKLGLVPGVSTIIGCCAKPGLEVWKIDQAIMAALTLPRIDGESSDSFVSRVKVDAKETARKAAEKGTAIHAAIQGFYETGHAERDFFPYITASAGAVEQLVPECESWEAERSFASNLGFGGKCDLSCPVAVLDFKSKEFDATTDLKTWDEHSMQLAAYRHGLGMPKARCAIVYVSVTNPGLAKLIEIPEEELQQGWKMFAGLLAYWTAKTGYNSSWNKSGGGASSGAGVLATSPGARPATIA